MGSSAHVWSAETGWRAEIDGRAAAVAIAAGRAIDERKEKLVGFEGGTEAEAWAQWPAWQPARESRPNCHARGRRRAGEHRAEATNS